MTRNATASWSGFAHQGKVGFLVALRKINALQDAGSSLAGYSVEYETQEDVKISQNGQPIEVHQVKAFTTADTKGSYTTAIDEYEPCPGDNYIHTLLEIRNWDELTNQQNPIPVIRYPYSPTKNHCHLNEIADFIDDEINNLLFRVGHPSHGNPYHRKNCAQEYFAELDERIRIEHQHMAQVAYNVNLSFAEIAELISNPSTKHQSKIFAIRKRLYTVFEDFISELDLNSLVVTPAQEVVANDVIRKIYSLPDEGLIQFLYNINPHSSSGTSFHTCDLTDNFFVSANFYSVFLRALLQITALPFSLDNRNIPSYLKNQSFLLTCITGDDFLVRRIARQILENDLVDFSAYENDYLITEQYDGKLADHALKILPSNPQKFMSKKEMKFITIANAITELNTQP